MAGSRKTRILVVVDDPFTRQALTLLLEMQRHQVTQAANGREALDLIRKGPTPNLILLDLMMPVMDGWEFLRQRREVGALLSVPVVVVSAVADLDKAVAAGASAVLHKP